jgi:hypothetical protein
MEAPSFDLELRALARRQPFQPFTVEFVSGEKIEIDHPEALVFRKGVAVHIDVNEVPTLFDHQGVARLIGKIDKPAPA